jgi:hypothetical protein
MFYINNFKSTNTDIRYSKIGYVRTDILYSFDNYLENDPITIELFSKLNTILKLSLYLKVPVRLNPEIIKKIFTYNTKDFGIIEDIDNNCLITYFIYITKLNSLQVPFNIDIDKFVQDVTILERKILNSDPITIDEINYYHKNEIKYYRILEEIHQSKTNIIQKNLLNYLCNNELYTIIHLMIKNGVLNNSDYQKFKEVLIQNKDPDNPIRNSIIDKIIEWCDEENEKEEYDFINNLIKFTTGYNNIPTTVKEFKIDIIDDTYTNNEYNSHTCFNTLDLREDFLNIDYINKETFKNGIVNSLNTDMVGGKKMDFFKIWNKYINKKV